jgi:FkbM family methyltransferase
MRPHLPRAIHVARIVANRRSYRTLRRLMKRGAAGPAGAPVGIELRPLGGRTVWIRPGTSDADVVWDTFVGRYHLPPRDRPGRPVSLIWDLGSNIGLTMADLAVRFPRARILGVELEPANAALARRNIEPWSDRCELLEAAVWTHDGTIAFDGTAGEEHGFRVSEAGARGAAAIALGTLRARSADGPDYVKMDIEGAERDVLGTATGWAADVRTFKVEVHDPYTVQDCAEQLERLGFGAAVDRRHWACVAGVRDP